MEILINKSTTVKENVFVPVVLGDQVSVFDSDTEYLMEGIIAYINQPCNELIIVDPSGNVSIVGGNFYGQTQFFCGGGFIESSPCTMRIEYGIDVVDLKIVDEQWGYDTVSTKEVYGLSPIKVGDTNRYGASVVSVHTNGNKCAIVAQYDGQYYHLIRDFNKEAQEGISEFDYCMEFLNPYDRKILFDVHVRLDL